MTNVLTMPASGADATTGVRRRGFFFPSKLFRRGGVLCATQLVAHGVLLAAAFAVLFPFYWMVATSFKAPDEVFTGSFHWLPETFVGMTNYVAALEKADLALFALNGLVVCLGVLLVQCAVALPAGWALARYDFRGKRALFVVVLLGLAVPIQAPAIPLFLGLAEFDLLDTFFALMFPFFLSVFAIFLFRQAFMSFPEEIVLAARTDGVSEAGILWRMAVPSIRPQIAAFAVFSFVAHWNDLYWPLIVVTTPEMVTPPLGLAQFADPETGTNFGALMAAATLMVLPVTIFFAILQKDFMEGMTRAGVK